MLLIVVEVKLMLTENVVGVRLVLTGHVVEVEVEVEVEVHVVGVGLLTGQMTGVR